MHSIALVNTDKSPCPGTHNAACMEFIQGFTDYGFTASEAKRLEDCSGKTIILLSNHNIDISYLHQINDIAPDAVYILWFYHKHIDQLPFKKWILTGEHYYYPPTLATHIPLYNIYSSISNYVPLLLRANEDPSMIGKYDRSTIIYNGCFMGTPYKYDWVVEEPNILYHTVYRGLLSYEQRREIYLKSKVAFGFIADANAANHHITQRVFEGLAYGCVVICNSKTAYDMTDGIVDYAETKAEFIEKYNYYLANPEICHAKAIAGYEWSRKYGTNRYAAKLFLDKIEELWSAASA